MDKTPDFKAVGKMSTVITSMIYSWCKPAKTVALFMHIGSEREETLFVWCFCQEMHGTHEKKDSV